MSIARRTPSQIIQAVFDAVYAKLAGYSLIDGSQVDPKDKLNTAQEARTKFAAAEAAKVAAQFAFIVQTANPPVYRDGSGGGIGAKGTVQRGLTTHELDLLNQMFAAAFPN